MTCQRLNVTTTETAKRFLAAAASEEDVMPEAPSNRTEQNTTVNVLWPAMRSLPSYLYVAIGICPARFV
jgi:hypothetical protein